ncbi:GrpB family protein [Kitasatospora sp. NBC_01266]|uniref:GrpB family protein n=1 Tax=Kitasatospora sp. NBC_01266 TaxID=2903572 RepID=UPI002E3211B7|nr:GrpB family protein [Kitasatospora sp. NBC_01266]
MPKDTKPAAPIVVDPDPAWQAQGIALASELRSLLAPLALHVEHIGSTAIPGMAAKPMFDLQVSVLDLRQAEDAFDQPLADRGFQRSRYQHDHVPAGRDDDPQRWAKRLWSRRGGHSQEADVNLHVRLLGSPNERLALLFRDWFRAHPEAVPAYAAFKRVLADNVREIGSYADVKDPVVDLVITVAESWAGEAGWTPHAATGPGSERN